MAGDWAAANHVEVKAYPADWEDVDAPGAVVKERADGTKYNLRAGPDRNRKMATLHIHDIDMGVAFITPKSKGTHDMVNVLLTLVGVPVFEVTAADWKYRTPSDPPSIMAALPGSDLAPPPRARTDSRRGSTAAARSSYPRRQPPPPTAGDDR